MSEIAVPNVDDLLLTDLSLFRRQQLNESQWTLTQKIIGQGGVEYWTGKAAVTDVATESDERQWRAFLFGLRGMANWFRWTLPFTTHSGAKPTVGSGASDGYTLPLVGMVTGQTILEAGQYMTVPLPSGRYRAVILTADLVTDISGAATAQFEPALSETPTSGVTVETKDPFIPMRAAAPTLGMSVSNAVSGTSFDVREYR